MLNYSDSNVLKRPAVRHSGLLTAINDIKLAFKRLPLILMLASQDLKQRYRRSFIGPFWLTINMAVMIGSIGLIFGQIFHAPMKEFLPFLSVGLILWGMITTVLTEGCQGFIAAESMIKQLSLPLFVHILRLICRNIFIIAHHLCLFPIVCWAVGAPITLMSLLTLPGFVILIANLSWMVLFLAVVCTRFRDFPQIVTNILQVLFYVTPIIWLPSILPERMATLCLNPNPFYHLIEIVRAPLLGAMPSVLNYTVAMGMAVVGWMITLLIYGRCKRMIVYWI